MKKIVFLTLILLTSCQAFSDRIVPVMTVPIPITATPITMDVFTLNDQCPYVCWLGINPGKTTIEEVKTLLATSNQIDQESLKIYGNSAIDVVWYDRGKDAHSSYVEVEFRDGVASSIFFGYFHFSVDDFVMLLGEPSQISVTIIDGVEAIGFDYALYFTTHKVLLYSYPLGIQNGPQSTDGIARLVLNTEIYKYTFSEWDGKLQQWLGYGHMKEYLQGQELPPDFIMPGP